MAQNEHDNKPSQANPLVKQDWSTFRKTGLFHFVNSFLHIFGWVLVLDMDDSDNVTAVYPARTIYRGFAEKSNDLAYERITEFMKQEFGGTQNDK